MKPTDPPHDRSRGLTYSRNIKAGGSAHKRIATLLRPGVLAIN